MFTTLSLLELSAASRAHKFIVVQPQATTEFFLSCNNERLGYERMNGCRYIEPFMPFCFLSLLGHNLDKFYFYSYCIRENMLSTDFFFGTHDFICDNLFTLIV